MSFVALAAGTLVGAAVVVGGILVWARGRVQGRGLQDAQAQSRQHYLNLAAQAASDGSGRGLLALLDALDAAPADCPVTVSWLRHQAPDKPAGMLVRISWDGNEWRRIMPWTPFRDQLRAQVEAHPGAGARARQLLADLEAGP
jgi:hypothetical protein